MTTINSYDLDYLPPAPGFGKYLFVDLDETLIHYCDFEKDSYIGPHEVHEFQGKLMLLRPEAHELLKICREWADKVVMCTYAGDIYACIANVAFEYLMSAFSAACRGVSEFIYKTEGKLV